jgi:predicted metal-dependent HD superfamily phosphohydrolase
VRHEWSSDRGDAASLIGKVAASLRSRYAEPHRRYHNQSHIDALLGLFAEVRADVQSPTSFELGIWYHDAIYEPKRTDNEHMSSLLARDELSRYGASAVLIEQVVGHVLATADHNSSGGHPDTPLFLDIDLSILGSDTANYRRYADDIRSEYAWVDSATYNARRAEILARFLRRPRIYCTPTIATRLEQSARANLAWELKMLADSGPIGPAGAGNQSTVTEIPQA